MTIAPLTLKENYWENFTITDQDLEFLYNYLLENETPLTSLELAEVLTKERIRGEIAKLSSRQSGTSILYKPNSTYEIGNELQFPALDWVEGKVAGMREGKNPETGTFQVVDVLFKDGTHREFASGLENHTLNAPIEVNTEDPSFNPTTILSKYGEQIQSAIQTIFGVSEDLVQIAGAWFPRSLLVDVSLGYLNLAEAVLEMESGGPLPTKAILEQIELPTDVNLKLTEFSMNLALQEDERFDEVGPSGETLWFLKRMEPEWVQNPTPYLRFQPGANHNTLFDAEAESINQMVYDELETEGDLPRKADEITVSLLYPHWRSGTIPLSKSIARLFPTAYEAPRIQFTFVDSDTGKEYPGWVVRPYRYIFGLKEWYEENSLIPGSLFGIKQGKKPGQVIIKAMKKRPTKEWVRTVLVGTDGGIVFTMLKQQISTEIDDRMVIAVPDVPALDKIWESHGRSRQPLEKTVVNIMRELIKLSPQGHVHAQELYAGVNVVRRCPPTAILDALANTPNAIHMGDLYFRLNDPNDQETPYE